MKTHPSAPRPRIKAALVSLWETDRLVVILIAFFVLSQLLAAGWDLPGSHGWETDGIAPRDLFGGLAFNLTPGRGHRYPLLHYLIVGILSFPLLAWAALQADSFSLEALTQQMLAPGIMTGVSVVAKLVSIAMASISLWTLAKIVRRTVSVNAGRYAVAFAGANLAFAYYGRTSNLDGPYLMWTVLAMDRLLSIHETGRRRDYLWFAVLAAAAVATKDQAYASFVFPGLVYLVFLPVIGSRAQGISTGHWRYLSLAGLLGALAYGVFSWALFNPTGFLSRLARVTGGASQNWRVFEPSLDGLVANVANLAANQGTYFWPWLLVVAVWIGVPIAAILPNSEGLKRRTFRLLPLVVGLSSVMCFTLVVGRAGHRFLLPLGFWLAAFGGVVGDEATRHVRGRWRMLAVTGLVGMLSLGALNSWRLHLTQWGDARNQVVAYLETLPRGSCVETYGLLVYQPHFDVSPSSPYTLQRVGPKKVGKRNPLFGAREVEGLYGDVHRRAPDVLVVTERFASRFVSTVHGTGFSTSVHSQAFHANSDGRTFFTAATTDGLTGYRTVLVAEPHLPGWARWLGGEPVSIHGATAGKVWILRRSSIARKVGRTSAPAPLQAHLPHQGEGFRRDASRHLAGASDAIREVDWDLQEAKTAL